MARAKKCVGKPKKWATREALEQDIEKYFTYCDTNHKHPTIAGLAYYLEVDRQTIYNYSYNEDYFDIINKARNKIMMNLEETAIVKGNAGTIFVMKQYGYKDKHEVDNNITGDAFNSALKSFVDRIQ
jgi:hypothetical protein